MKNLDHVNIDLKNSLYLVFNNVDGYTTEENNEDKRLIFDFPNNNKEILGQYKKLWNEIKNQIKTKNGVKPIQYKRDLMKIKFESNDDLPLRKMLNIPIIVITGLVFQEGSKYQPQVLLHECVYKYVDKVQKVGIA